MIMDRFDQVREALALGLALVVLALVNGSLEWWEVIAGTAGWVLGIVTVGALRRQRAARKVERS